MLHPTLCGVLLVLKFSPRVPPCESPVFACNEAVLGSARKSLSEKINKTDEEKLSECKGEEGISYLRSRVEELERVGALNSDLMFVLFAIFFPLIFCGDGHLTLTERILFQTFVVFAFSSSVLTMWCCERKYLLTLVS